MLDQFFDAPASSSQQQRGTRRGNQQQRGASAGGGYFGSAKRTDLNDQTMLNTPSEHGKLGGAFGRANVADDHINLPRTEAQKILHRDNYSRNDDEIFVVVPEHYTIAGVVPPTNKVLKVPKVSNPYLMTPKQRREFSQFERKKLEADKLARKARMDKQRMLDLMKTQFPGGVIGMEQVEPKYGERIANPYKAERDAAASSYQRAVAAQAARKQHIVKNSDSLQRRGYNFVQQTGKAPIQGAIAARKGAGAGRPQHDTHNRLFARDEYKHNPDRAARLLQHDTRGRNFDLITGVRR